jgi:hypothetical protein
MDEQEYQKMQAELAEWNAQQAPAQEQEYEGEYTDEEVYEAYVRMHRK